jgi:dTDP-4-dehydrorhamnose 3,5-epimerase
VTTGLPDASTDEFAGLDPGQDLLDLLLASATRDAQTVKPSGEERARLPDGVTFHRSRTHVDDRGWLVELFDPRWGWHPLPAISVYATTLRPGAAKGWAMHKEHEDRYAILVGHIELALFDVRPGSPTRGLLARTVLSEYDRGNINIPAYVWHGTRNVGQTEAILVNLPTVPFDHANPDKYRLPIDTPLIPYDFGGTRGW